MIELNNEVEVTIQLQSPARWESEAMVAAFVRLCDTTGLHLQFKSDRLLIKGPISQVADAIGVAQQVISEHKPKV